MTSFIEKCVRYMSKIECRYCGEYVYPHEDDARDLAEHWIQVDGMTDIAGLRQRIDRTFDYCDHMQSKDD
jgi:hypothetical protein